MNEKRCGSHSGSCNSKNCTCKGAMVKHGTSEHTQGHQKQAYSGSSGQSSPVQRGSSSESERGKNTSNRRMNEEE